MSEKKRKNHSKESDRPSKKHQASANVTVKHIESTTVQPIIGSAPGITLPTNIKFRSFARKTKDDASTFLLHSNEHPTIDFTATEGDTSIDKHIQHYVAIYDPSTGMLEVTKAKKLNFRGSIRTSQPLREDTEEDGVAVTNYSSRAALTEAFGTKKSRKAVQSMAENRLLAQGSEAVDNPVSAAMMSNLSEDDALNSSQGDAAQIANKPIPQPDLSTNEIAEVYSLRVLVAPNPSERTLATMPINTWTARISNQKEVLSRSRFVANRVGYLAKHLLNSPEASDPNLKKHLQILRYIQILIELHRYVRNLPRKRPIPPPDKWPDETLSESTPMSLIPGILQQFFTGDKLPTPHAMTLLRTTILALTLHIPPPSLETGQGLLVTQSDDLALDMAIDASELRKLYRELGCKVETATEAELSRWGLEKLGRKGKKGDSEKGSSSSVGGVKLLFAKLRLPLSFPKVSRGKPQGRR